MIECLANLNEVSSKSTFSKLHGRPCFVLQLAAFVNTYPYRCFVYASRLKSIALIFEIIENRCLFSRASCQHRGLARAVMQKHCRSCKPTKTASQLHNTSCKAGDCHVQLSSVQCGCQATHLQSTVQAWAHHIALAVSCTSQTQKHAT